MDLKIVEEMSPPVISVKGRNRLFPSFRILILCLASVQIAVIAASNVTMYFAWICMVGSPFSDSKNPSTDGYNLTNSTEPAANLQEDDESTIAWGNNEKKFIFSADSIGAIICLLPAGWLINRYGTHYVLPGGIFITVVACFLIPICAPLEYGFQLVVFLRGLHGVGFSVAWPSIYYVCSRYSPKHELGVSLSLVSSGLQLGSFSTLLLSSVECAVIGWPSVFYITASVSAVAALLWLIFYTNDPKDNKFMKETEKEYIVRKRKPIAERTSASVPWKGVLLSLPMYAAITCSISHTFVSQLVRRFTPTYFKDIVGLPIIDNGVSSSLQYLFQLVTRLLAGLLSDRKMVLRICRSHTVVLKTFNSLGLGLATVGLLGLTFMTKDSPQALPVFLITATMGAVTLCTAGWQKSPLMMAPKYSSAIGALILFTSNISSISVPYIFVAVVPNSKDPGQWQHMFYISIALAAITAVVFLIFGSGESQEEKWLEKKPKVQAEKIVKDDMIVIRF